MKKYSIKQLARLAKVSIRTLHYYDEIKLLMPTEKNTNGYRFYRNEDLLRLQQVMFYKELGFSLESIKSTLDNPNFDLKQALQTHRIEIANRFKQFEKLLTTIDKTLQNLNHQTMLNDEEMYQGFTPEQVKEYRTEVVQKWGEKSLLDSEKKVQKMSPKQWKQTKDQGEAITKKLAELMDINSVAKGDPAHKEVQNCIAAWHEFLENFYPVTEERLRGLGNMYVEDARFTAYYEKFGKGLASFKNKAIQIYCDRGMKVVG